MNPGLNIYLLFVISWFLHLTARLPVLGTLRIDLLLVCGLMLILLSRRSTSHVPKTDTDKLLRTLVLYSIVTIPLVEWPGSVLNRGISELIKAVVFYYFTVGFIDSERSLQKLVLAFVGCQLFRVMEPLYLHVTEGYWGSYASMANWEYLDRLSGAPYDIVNPNGLAFIICSVLPFLYFLARLSWAHRLAFWIFSPLCVYALALTGSRTGFLGLVVIALGIVAKSKRRTLAIVTIALATVVAFPMLSADMQDRYLSIFGLGEKNEGTAEGRVAGLSEDFRVAMRRPLFGHGLGTSREANANFGIEDKPAHNLYAETAEEIGFIGLIILLLFIKSIFSSFRRCREAYLNKPRGTVLTSVVDALQVWLFVNIVFSFASYGLSSYEWYLLGGFSVVLQRLAASESNAIQAAGSQRLTRVHAVPGQSQ